MIKNAPYGMSGACRKLSEITILDENSVCGVGRGAFRAGNSIARNFDNKRYR